MNEVEFEEVFNLKQGNHLPINELHETGEYDVFGANGIVGKYTKYMYEQPTVLVTCRGATCGSINLTTPNSWVTGNAIALIPKKDVDTKFIYYQLKGTAFQDVISGSAQPQIILSTLRRKKIKLPELQTQKQIAQVLEDADRARQLRKAANALTEQFLQSSFLHLFGDPLANEKDWDTQFLKKLIRSSDKINYGIVQPGNDVENGIPIVRISNFSGLSIEKQNLKKVLPSIDAKHKNSRLVGDEVLLACVGHTIGKVGLADESLKGFNIVRAVARIRCNEGILNRYFLAYYLQSKGVQDFFIRELRTVGQPTLNIAQIEQTRIIVPPLPLQQHFASLVADAEILRQKQQQSERELEHLFQALLQQYFGESKNGSYPMEAALSLAAEPEAAYKN